ncbi:MAG: hypothetical protein JJT94_11975 [Bernardetiaceae bacterium]|nr:hypothetical protein [Bernardetiaceae bacterium]
MVEKIYDFRWALIMAVLTLIFGFAIGALFGIAEDALKLDLSVRGKSVLSEVYNNDLDKCEAVVKKSWTYYKRAHLHANGLGTSAIALIFILLSVKSPILIFRQAVGVLLGVGSLGYSIFWLWAGYRAPLLGSTGLAKESLQWLAIPSVACLLIGILITFISLFLVKKEKRRRKSA